MRRDFIQNAPFLCVVRFNMRYLVRRGHALACIIHVQGLLRRCNLSTLQPLTIYA
jgi:hypothetical protein